MHPFSPPRFSHKYERRLLIFIMGTTMGNEKENKQDRRRRFSRESLTFKINSCGGKKNTGARRRRIHYPLAFDTRRVAHQVSSLANTAFQQHSFHFTTHVHPTCLSLEPDTCSSFPPSTRLANGMGEISPPLFDLVPILDVESKKSTHPVCLHSCAVIRLRVVRKGGGSVFFLFRG